MKSHGYEKVWDHFLFLNFENRSSDVHMKSSVILQICAGLHDYYDVNDIREKWYDYTSVIEIYFLTSSENVELFQ